MAKTKKGSYKIPFLGKDQVVYAGYGEYEWRENEPFIDVIEYQGYSRGRSAANFSFKSCMNGQTYNMFMTDMSDIIPHMQKGILKGRFKFVKRGQNYGLRLLEDE